jgi:hypothetical protein
MSHAWTVGVEREVFIKIDSDNALSVTDTYQSGKFDTNEEAETHAETLKQNTLDAYGSAEKIKVRFRFWIEAYTEPDAYLAICVDLNQKEYKYLNEEWIDNTLLSRDAVGKLIYLKVVDK